MPLETLFHIVLTVINVGDLNPNKCLFFFSQCTKGERRVKHPLSHFTCMGEFFFFSWWVKKHETWKLATSVSGSPGSFSCCPGPIWLKPCLHHEGQVHTQEEIIGKETLLFSAFFFFCCLLLLG